MKKTNNVTPCQLKVLRAISYFISKHGYSPTTRELCKLLDLNSPATINSHLNNLKEKRLITFKKGEPRTLRLNYKNLNAYWEVKTNECI